MTSGSASVAARRASAHCCWVIGADMRSGRRALQQFDESIAQVARLDGAMLATAVALSILASIFAGLLPTWRACQVVPALQLKSQ